MNIFQKILQEVLEKPLMKTTLFEMAYSRQKALDILRSYQDTISDHLIKCILFPEHQDFEHWCYEIDHILYEKIKKIRLKPNGRYLKYQDYFEILFDEPLGHKQSIDDILNGMYRMKRIPNIPNIDFEFTRMNLKYIYEELCDDLTLGNYKEVKHYLEILK